MHRGVLQSPREPLPGSGAFPGGSDAPGLPGAASRGHCLRPPLAARVHPGFPSCVAATSASAAGSTECRDVRQRRGTAPLQAVPKAPRGPPGVSLGAVPLPSRVWLCVCDAAALTWIQCRAQGIKGQQGSLGRLPGAVAGSQHEGVSFPVPVLAAGFPGAAGQDVAPAGSCWVVGAAAARVTLSGL